MRNDLPPGLSARPPELADAAALRDLCAAQGQASVGSDDVTLAEIMTSLTGPRVDLPRDGLVVVDQSGSDARIVAWGMAMDDSDDRGSIDVYVHPDRDEQEFARLARLLISKAVARLGDLARSRGRTQLRVGAGTYHGERICSYYAEAGFSIERVYQRLDVELAGAGGYDAVVPRGVTIRPVDPLDAADLAIVTQVHNEAMKGEYSHRDYTPEEFRAFWSTRAGFDPTAWWLGVLDGVPAGIALCDDSHAEDDAGWVRTLGVCDWARGRGIARALLTTAFADYARRGRAHVMLAVDSVNPTGATQLYESVGMRPVLTIDAWSLTLSTADGAAAT
jgi:mycothiol synthase